MTEVHHEPDTLRARGIMNRVPKMLGALQVVIIRSRVYYRHGALQALRYEQGALRAGCYKQYVLHLNLQASCYKQNVLQSRCVPSRVCYIQAGRLATSARDVTGSLTCAVLCVRRARPTRPLAVFTRPGGCLSPALLPAVLVRSSLPGWRHLRGLVVGWVRDTRDVRVGR